MLKHFIPDSSKLFKFFEILYFKRNSILATSSIDNLIWELRLNLHFVAIVLFVLEAECLALQAINSVAFTGIYFLCRLNLLLTHRKTENTQQVCLLDNRAQS